MNKKSEKHIRLECPKWHSPLLRVVDKGIEIRCRSCRGEVHFFSKEDLEAKWNELLNPSKIDR